MTDPLEIQLLPDMDTVVLVFQHQTTIGFSEITVNNYYGPIVKPNNGPLNGTGGLVKGQTSQK